MSVGWVGVGSHRCPLHHYPRRPRWQLAMAPRLLLLLLLCRARPWAWASELPREPAASPSPLPLARAATGSPLAEVVMASATPSSTVSQALNDSASQALLASNLTQMLHGSLFALSGCCSLAALYFLGRSFILKAYLGTKYRLLASKDHLKSASMDSDEDTVYDLRLNQ